MEKVVIPGKQAIDHAAAKAVRVDMAFVQETLFAQAVACIVSKA